jgi:hypothetical protein
MDLVMSFLLPALVGAVVFSAFQLLKKASDFVDGLSPLVKRFAVALLAALSVWLSTKFGVALPENPLGMDEATLSTFLTAVFAYVYHWIKGRVAA